MMIERNNAKLLYLESTKCDGVLEDTNCHALSKWKLDLLRSRQDLELRKGGLGYAPLRRIRSEDGRTEEVDGETSIMPNTYEDQREQEKQ